MDDVFLGYNPEAQGAPAIPVVVRPIVLNTSVPPPASVAYASNRPMSIPNPTLNTMYFLFYLA